MNTSHAAGRAALLADQEGVALEALIQALELNLEKLLAELDTGTRPDVDHSSLPFHRGSKTPNKRRQTKQQGTRCQH